MVGARSIRIGGVRLLVGYRATVNATALGGLTMATRYCLEKGGYGLDSRDNSIVSMSKAWVWGEPHASSATLSKQRPCVRRSACATAPPYNGTKPILSRHSSRLDAAQVSSRSSIAVPMSISCATRISSGLDRVAVNRVKCAGMVPRSCDIRIRFSRAAMARTSGSGRPMASP